MYSVFLVEDEIAAREGIRNSIPWERTPYTFAGEAPDGEMALPALRDIKPDILITDIKMPFMDGLALARIIRKDQPWMKIIILSGHDEFQYAQEAISIGVEEYLLKPVSSAEMMKSLEKAADQIEEEKKRLTRIENLKMKVQSNEELVREKWLCDLVTGQADAVNVIETAQELGIDLPGGGYVVLIAEISIDSDDYRQCAAAKKAIASAASGRDDIVIFSQSAEREILLVKHVTRDSLDEAVYPLAQAVKFEVERNTGCRVSIGIGSVVDHAGETKRSYAYANKAVRYMSHTGEKNIIGAGDLQMEGDETIARYGSGPSIHTKHHAIIRKAEAFIRQNYMNADISLDSVASSVCMSPNHFSTVFSQEAGKTFIEYLTQIRIRRAKQLLLQSDMKCSDITYEAGYSDPHYFSFIFKKHTGFSPREFRAAQKIGSPQKIGSLLKIGSPKLNS